MRFLEKALERLWFSCGGHCHTHAGGSPSCPLLDGADPTQHLLDPHVRRFSTGGALVAAATTVFLLPLATAIGGAYLAGACLPSSFLTLGLRQALGMLAGLAIGIGLARLLLLLIRPKPATSGGGDE